jgi:hypothetical protein
LRSLLVYEITDGENMKAFGRVYGVSDEVSDATWVVMEEALEVAKELDVRCRVCMVNTDDNIWVPRPQIATADLEGLLSADWRMTAQAVGSIWAVLNNEGLARRLGLAFVDNGLKLLEAVYDG